MKRGGKSKLATGVLMVLSAAAGAGAGIAAKNKLTKKNSDDALYARKHLAIMQLFNQWMITKQEGKSIVDYLHKNNVKTVAIYGMSYVGERLYDELKGSDITVKYAIDKNADKIYADVDVLTPEEELPEVDLIIVTATFFYDEIEEQLSEVTECAIASLEDILYEL